VGVGDAGDETEIDEDGVGVELTEKLIDELIDPETDLDPVADMVVVAVGVGVVVGDEDEVAEEEAEAVVVSDPDDVLEALNVDEAVRVGRAKERDATPTTGETEDDMDPDIDVLIVALELRKGN